MKKLLSIGILLIAAIGGWLFISAAKTPAAAETSALSGGDAKTAAEFVSAFRTQLAANDAKAWRKLCDNPDAPGLAASVELLRNTELSKQPERAEARTAQPGNWSLYYPTDAGTLQVVLHKMPDGSFRFRNAYR